ncbi:polyketide synthase [Pseudomassariella vexata]|uniref:Polyketide synthase n=1 Tax=Pseudomassariella vexata TaxID=1141098 RepID=A0A1Y2DJB2_9PEZI|nr:polyketide synthase [Pseudomassariella vexata]ORY59299.1 polyketide synthase [Pseudomassariella vexata]
MNSQVDIYVFGDQTLDVSKKLQGLLVSDSTLLTEFFDGAFRTLQREISRLPSSKRQEFPRSETLGLLLEAIQNGKRHSALDSALVTIYEIAYYIQWVLLCAKTIFDIKQVGVQAVAAAFRIGYHVHQRAEALGYFEAESWSAVVSHIQEIKEEGLIEAVVKFCTEQGLPLSSQPYISAVAPTSATVSGPPTVLQNLLSSPVFSGMKSTLVPVYGPYHCPHAYSKSDVEQILDSVLDGLEFLDRVAYTPCLSCASQTHVNDSTLGGLLREFASHALAKQMRIDQVIDGLSELPVAKLIPVNTQMLPTLAAGLRRKGKAVETEGTVPAPTQTKSDLDSQKIAVVGFSGRFPEADSIAEFWDLLQKGLDVVKPVPANRFDGDAHFDPTGKRKNTSRVNHGCWIREPGLFDTRFFQVSPREASQMDPAQRLALLTAYEAIEMAGLVADRTPSTRRHRVGVYFGTTSDDWREINNSQNIDTYFIPGGIRAFIPGRINYFFKFSGPSISVDTACSSSLAAINIAVASLLNRDCDSAIAGGTNILTNPDNFAGLDRGHFLSTTGNCKAFDDGADGYCRADGIGTVVLKRLSDAIADKDPIFGVIMGAVTNHSAEAVSITRPLADAQEYIFKRLLNETGVNPHDVSYIETHGTGTQAGDAVEMEAILNTFSWDHSRASNKALHLGSVKANVGHGESASGITALIKVLLMMQKSKIPPHCGIKDKINKQFAKDLSQRGVHIALTEKDWNRPKGGKRRAFVNNFSAAGGNTALLVEDAPTRAVEIDGPQDGRSHHVVTVSARSAKSMKGNLAALASYIGESEGSHLLSQISYTSTARRMHHRLRLAFVATDLQQLRSQLTEAATNATENLKQTSTGKAPRMGFLFTGQGAQETAMAKGFFQNVSTFHCDIRNFDAIVMAQGFPSVLPLIDGNVVVEELPPTVVQLGTCVIQIALARLWINLGAMAQYVIGHSLGEYAALHTAGVLSISDAIWLCGLRATLMEKRCTAGTHCMLAVKASHEQLRLVIAGTEVEVACVNGPQDTVLAGPNIDIEEILRKLDELKYKSRRLALPFAFHSSQVAPLLDEFEKATSRITFHKPRMPFLSTLLGRAIQSGDVFGTERYLARQCRESVNFLGAVESGQADGIIKSEDICIEIGAHTVLSKMMTSIVGAKVRCYPSLRRGEDTFKTLSGSLGALYSAGVDIDWNEYHRDFPSSQKVLDLPSYSWDLERCWIQYNPSWCLTKGDAVSTVAPLALRSKPTRLSASVQDILEQTVDEDHARIVIQSDLHDPELAQAAQEHVVGGLALCSSSLYADIAYTLATHLAKARYPNGQAIVPDVCNMSVTKSLVVKDEASQLIGAAMDIDWTSGRGSMDISSVDGSGKSIALHGTCDIVFQEPRVWLEMWERNSYLIQRSIQKLHQGVDASLTHKFGGGMAYKLFSVLMKYGPSYQGMEEVVFDSLGLEATAKVRLQPTKGKYGLNPCWIDSFGHITGFVMNSNDSLDLTDHVYVNHGWSHMRCSEPFIPDVSYQTYVKMQRVEKDKDTAYAGDVYVLREEKIVAVYERVQFNKLPRRILNMMQPSSNKKTGKISARAAVKKPEVPKPASKVSEKISAAPKSAPKEYGRKSTVFQKALQVISDEMGADLEKLADDACFADYGLDSLMTLTILGTFRESLALDFPGSLFEDYSTKKALRDLLSPSMPGSSTEDSDLSESKSDIDGINTTMTTPTETPAHGFNQAEDTVVIIYPLATSVILQGGKKQKKTLFLLPDGSGSCTSYTALPTISPDLCVVGLNCPYMKTPEALTCSLLDLVGLYVAEIRRRQPEGPYTLAGWSAGGILAYEAAQRLVDAGETVEGLMIIDSPNPIGIEKLPPRFYELLSAAGIFGGEGGKGAPAWLVRHFLATVEVLDQWKPGPFRGRAPATSIIWAKQGVIRETNQEPQPGDTREMRWLLEDRKEEVLGYNGWDVLLAKSIVSVACMDEAHHFSMVKAPHAAVLADLIRKALS